MICRAHRERLRDLVILFNKAFHKTHQTPPSGNFTHHLGSALSTAESQEIAWIPTYSRTCHPLRYLADIWGQFVTNQSSSFSPCSCSHCNTMMQPAFPTLRQVTLAKLLPFRYRYPYSGTIVYATDNSHSGANQLTLSIATIKNGLQPLLLTSVK